MQTALPITLQHATLHFRRKYFLDLNIGISCACLEPLVYFNLMNLWSVMLTDHDSMLAIEYLTTCISLSFFMLLYFVYHCKLPYILLDIGDDEWLEVHFKGRLRILSLELGGKEPWFWEKLPASLALHNYDSHFSILLAMALLLLLMFGVPTGADREWRSRRLFEISALTNAVYVAVRKMDWWDQANNSYPDYHPPGVWDFTSSSERWRWK